MALPSMSLRRTRRNLRSWQIALAMLVTLPLMALGAVLMSTAVLDAMTLAEMFGDSELFCSFPFVFLGMALTRGGAANALTWVFRAVDGCDVNK